MNRDILQGHWQQAIGAAIKQWALFTDDRLRWHAGEHLVRAGRMQESHGLTKDQAEQQMKVFRKISKDFRPGHAPGSVNRRPP